MKIEIEISDDELREHILVAAGNALHKQYSTERNLYKRTIADCVREVIYKDKDEQPTLTPPNEPLTLEHLRASPHGKIKDSTLQSICNRANEIACRPPEGEEDTRWTFPEQA